MTLLTEKVREQFSKYPLYSQDNKGKNAICVAKFFLANWTWYIIEGQDEGDDFIMFGIVINGMGDEYGYVSMNELQNVKVNVKTPFGIIPLKVERDIWFEPKPLGEITDDPGLKKFLDRLYADDEETDKVEATESTTKENQ